eukprot:c11353_g1_i1.p2 GENE.c11353_g1_i1~~c11353_g1_i1.p2  ORF type:complete len:165 (+),score=21.92 c11353_g1_i1:56-496(+)
MDDADPDDSRWGSELSPEDRANQDKFALGAAKFGLAVAGAMAGHLAGGLGSAAAAGGTFYLVDKLIDEAQSHIDSSGSPNSQPQGFQPQDSSAFGLDDTARLAHYQSQSYNGNYVDQNPDNDLARSQGYAGGVDHKQLSNQAGKKR